MYIEDLLSRNFIKRYNENDIVMQDVDQTVGAGIFNMSEDKVKEFQEQTQKDESLKVVLEWYKKGWPKTCKIVGKIKHY